MKTSLLLATTFSLSASCSFAAPAPAPAPEPTAGSVGSPTDNLARKAKVSGKGRFLECAVDGVKGIHNKGEWIGGSPNEWFGWIVLPSMELSWDQPQTINKVVIYDRPGPADHMAACVLTFDDGSKVQVWEIPNDGSPKTVVFPAKTVKKMQVRAWHGTGHNIGLSEIEAYDDPSAKPAPAKKRELSDPVSHVDPTIETTRGRWFFCVPGSRPFGQVSAAAHTCNREQGGGGYNYSDPEILGFSQLHAWMLGGINLMPVAGQVDAKQGEQGWKSPFSHEREVIAPGYHQVFLDRYKTGVEYTATDHAAIYRIRGGEIADPKLLLSLGGWLGAVGNVDAKVRKIDATHLEGSVGMTDRIWGGPRLTHAFFVIETSRPITRMDGWKQGRDFTDIQSLENPVTEKRINSGNRYVMKQLPEEQAGVSLAYGAKPGEELVVKVGVSLTSIENARKNLETECPHWDFDRVRQETRAEWNRWLGRIEVKGGSEEKRVKFYTDLWHALLGRHRIDDMSGDFPSYMGKPGPNGRPVLEIQSVPKDAAGRPKFHMYNSDALWLTMWNLNILWGIGWPEVLDDFSASWVKYADIGGRLPCGPCSGAYTGIMGGSPGSSLLACAYQKGLMKKVEPAAAYEAMKRTQGGAYRGGVGPSVQKGFEYWALAQMAEKMGKQDEAKSFAPFINDWKQYFDPKTGLLMAKGETNPLSGRGWVEANAWQGSFGVVQDIDGLARLMGGKEVLAGKLNHAFEKSLPEGFTDYDAHSYICYSNQPGMAAAHVFNHAGAPWLSQYWVRQVSEKAFGGTDPNTGYGGFDEDQGQGGSLSALMKIGLFSLRGTCGQEPEYDITTPEFDEVVIHLNPAYYPGGTFTIKAHGNKPGNVYIQSASLNGKPLKKAILRHRDLVAGGTLELWLGPVPNKQWGVADQSPPPVTPAPSQTSTLP